MKKLPIPIVTILLTLLLLTQPAFAFDPTSILDLSLQDFTNTNNATPIIVTNYGASGSNTTTTGSITAGDNQLTLTSPIDMKNGEGIRISGAGSSAKSLTTTIVSGAGTTSLVLASDATTTINNAVVKHDDTHAIQSALDASNYIIIPPGKYNISSTINIPSSAYIVTAGINSVFYMQGQQVGFQMVNDKYVTVGGFQLYGNSIDGQVGIAIENANYIYMQGQSLTELDNGMYINSANGNQLVIDRPVIQNSNNGIVFNGANQVTILEPSIELGSVTATTTSSIEFNNLLGDPTSQSQLINVIGGHLSGATYGLNWKNSSQGLNINLSGVELEALVNVVGVQKNQDGNLHINMDNSIIFSDGETQMFLYGGSSISQGSATVVANRLSIIGNLTSNFKMTNLPNYYVFYYVTSWGKLSINIPTPPQTNYPLTSVISISPGKIYRNSLLSQIASSQTIYLPVYATTSGTSGAVTVYLGTSSPPAILYTKHISGNTSSSKPDVLVLTVPSNWVYSFNSTGVTFSNGKSVLTNDTEDTSSQIAQNP